MPDRRRHRGAAPGDHESFGPDALARMRVAVEELSWLLSRGYASDSALALVGNRHELVKRQREAVRRASCSDLARERRRARRLEPAQLARRAMWIDGYNVLTTVEAALAGGLVLRSRDGWWRDMASMHGSWRRVEETVPALLSIGEELARCGVGAVRWLLDAPVSNSGRLRSLVASTLPGHEVELVRDPDRELVEAAAAQPELVVATADSGILDAGVASFDLAGRVVRALDVDGLWLVELA